MFDAETTINQIPAATITLDAEFHWKAPVHLNVEKNAYSPLYLEELNRKVPSWYEVVNPAAAAVGVELPLPSLKAWGGLPSLEGILNPPAPLGGQQEMFRQNEK